MFAKMEDPDKAERVADIVHRLTALTLNKAHNKHFHVQDCEDMKLEIERLEQDPLLQDLVLTIHPCYMQTLGNGPAFKVIENHQGTAWVKIQQMAIMPGPSFNVMPSS